MFILAPLFAFILGFQEPALDTATSSGKSEYMYVGCHVVTKNPSKQGDVAFGPFGIITKIVFFKQISDDGSVGEVTTAKLCGK